MPVCGFAGIVKVANASAAFKLPSSIEAGHQDATVAQIDLTGSGPGGIGSDRLRRRPKTARLRREEGASSLAGSLAIDGHRPPLQAGSAVPGLAEVLLEMAERHPSKVLRLYAMQHLSLWFAKEHDPAKRRAMVELLEKLAARPGDETAGCAVLMLADMRRKETEDLETEDRRQDVAGPLADSGARAVTSAPTGDGIDWGRVDEILEGASRRLVGEAGAGADVRISAIHACVDRKDAGTLPELRKIAVDAGLVSTLRKAAIHALGQLGTAEDVALLESLPQDDPNLSQAVNPARKALADRTGRKGR